MLCKRLENLALQFNFKKSDIITLSAAKMLMAVCSYVASIWETTVDKLAKNMVAWQLFYNKLDCRILQTHGWHNVFVYIAAAEFHCIGTEGGILLRHFCGSENVRGASIHTLENELIFEHLIS